MINQILVAMVFHALDMITGVIAAIREHDLQSSKMRDGLFKKVGFVLCYALAILVDTQGQTIGMQLGVSILPVIVLYAVSTELVSVIENICRINPDMLPDTLKRMFHIMEMKGGENVDVQNSEEGEQGDAGIHTAGAVTGGPLPGEERKGSGD